jgi:hypothetical protein
MQWKDASMNTSVRLVSSRPLLIAIGPTATEIVHRDHHDLELVDLLVAESTPSIDELRWLGASHLLERSLTVVLFDARDEPFWPTAHVVAREARLRAKHPVWFVCADTRHGAARVPMLERLAGELDVCVIDPGDGDALDVALLGAAGLRRSGPVDIDGEDIACVARAGTVGRAEPMHMSTDSSVVRARIIMRCSNEVSLSAINDASKALFAKLPSAEVFLSTPMYPSASPLPLEGFVLAFRAA